MSLKKFENFNKDYYNYTSDEVRVMIEDSMYVFVYWVEHLYNEAKSVTYAKEDVKYYMDNLQLKNDTYSIDEIEDLVEEGMRISSNILIELGTKDYDIESDVYEEIDKYIENKEYLKGFPEASEFFNDKSRFGL